MKVVRFVFVVGALAFVASAGGSASADKPRVGATATPVVVSDLDGHPVAIPTGVRAVVFYEDDKSGELNLRAHKTVAKIVDRFNRQPGFDVMVVADVQRFNYWPGRSFAVKELRKVEKAERAPFFTDWTGAITKNWALTKGSPSVTVMRPDGTVQFFVQGTLTDKELLELETVLLSEIAQR